MKRLGFKKSIDLSGIDERISTSEGKIATLERTTSDINQALATAQSELTAKFDNLAVCGRNLLKNSQAERTVSNATTRETFVPAYVLTKPLEPNTAYILSFEYKTTDNARTAQVGFVSSVGQHKFKTDLTKTSDWQKGVFKFTTGNNANQAGHIRFDNEGTTDGQLASLWVKNVKLELGNVPSDWTPAPEDYTAGLAIYNTTTAQSPNVFVSDTGQLQRSTSSERYKEIISPLVLDDKAYKNAMKLNPIIYRSTAEADKQDWHYYSFSAEQLGQFDKAFTLWRTPTETIIDDNGEITITELEPIAEGINLNAIVAFLHATNVRQGMLIRDLTKRIEFLENQRDK